MKQFTRVVITSSFVLAFTAACDKKEAGASGDSTASKSSPAAPAAAAAGGGSKCKEAAEYKAKLKNPGVDPSTLGSVEFDKMDCESGKWSAGKADCILAAKDVAGVEKCQ